MYAIQNRMKRTFAVPAVMDVKTKQSHHAAVQIEPGDTALVNPDHWDSVKRGNQVIEALLTNRSLVVTKPEAVKDVHVDELANPASPTAPAELTEEDDRVKIDSKTEVKEVELSDEPKQARGPGRPRKA